MNVTEKQEQEFESWMKELDETEGNSDETPAEVEAQGTENQADAGEEAEVEEQAEGEVSEEAEQPESQDEEERRLIREFVLETDDDVIALGEKKLRAAEVKKLLQDYENDTKWKQKNQERGERLNKAEQVLQRMESDAEFAAWMQSYQDPRERELLQNYDEETARRIRQLEIENDTLRSATVSQQAEQQYLNEEKEMLQEGAHPEDLANAYGILVEQNRNYFKATGKPMSLKFAYGQYLADGGQKIVLERMLKQQHKQTKERKRVQQKQNLPTELGNSNSVAPTKMEPEDPLESDIWNEEMFKDIPVN